MKITLSWLKDFLDTQAGLDKIVETLNMLGLVVDGVIDRGRDLADFKIVHVISADKPPEAERLNVCQVNTGKETLQIVCGGVNARTGMKAVLAPIGSVIPTSGLQIKVTKIRGIESHGMLCSANELGLGENDPEGGIIELLEDAPVGMSYAQYAGLDDPVLDIDITPNRGDCLGAYGIARDLAAAGLGTLKLLEIPAIQETYESPVQVVIDREATGACPFFAGRVIQGVKNCPSPLWMQQRLQAIGLRPISALVDITNYLSYTLGRPMHVFDADILEGNILVRFAQEGETILALDANEYTLDTSMMVVADQKRPHSIAGIMGGEISGCTEATTNVFLESAIFDPISISLTGRALNITSDSRFRFERAVDANMVIPAIEIATKFILEHCGGRASTKVSAGKLPLIEQSVQFRPDRIHEMTGQEISVQTIKGILKDLGFLIQEAKEKWSVTPPSWRHDISLEADLIEEVARVYGYDKIPTLALPSAHGEEHFESYPGSNLRQQWGWHVRRALSAQGLSEALTWSFLSEDRAKLFGGGDPNLKLVNPISTDLSDMRPSLLPNLIDATQRNYDRDQQNICLFEVGKQFSDVTPEGEQQIVAGVRSGKTAPKHWAQAPRDVDIFDAKADAFMALEACGIDGEQLQIIFPGPSWYHPGRSGYFVLGPKNHLAAFGEIHPKVLAAMDIDPKIVGFEVYLNSIPLPKSRANKPLEISPYQPVERDFAFIVDAIVSARDVMQAAQKADRQLITNVNLFDVYEGQGIAQGKKSLALSVQIEPKEGTLTDIQLAELSEKIIASVKKLTGGELRS